MRLVACKRCHTQYDVTEVPAQEIRCTCGQSVSTAVVRAVDADVHRCGSCGALLVPDAAQCSYCNSAVVRDESRLSLVCPECYARNAEDSHFCTACGVEFSPQGIVDPGEELPCPRCPDSPLAARGVGGVRVSECPRCNGLWVPGKNFDSLVERSLAAQRVRPSAGLGLSEGARRKTAFNRKVEYRRCPVCEGTMQRKNFARRSGIIVDWCGKHGTWLDADELEDIASYILGGGLEREGGSLDDASWSQPGDEKRLEAMAAVDRLMAREKVARERRRWRPEGDGVLTWKTLSDVFSSLLGS